MIAADQGVSSLGNFLLQLAVIREADATSLAFFGITYSVYWLAVGTTRALVFEPLLVMAAQEDSVAAAATRRAALTVTLAWSLVVAGGVAAISLLLPSPADTQLAILAAGFVPLLVLDCLRYVAISSGAPRRALLLDGAWLVAQLGAFAAAAAAGAAGPETFLALWCATGALSLLLNAAGLRSAFSGVRAARLHWRASRGLGVPGAGEFALASGLQQLLPTALLLVGGVDVAASYRVAQTMVSPVNVLSSAATVASLPRAADHYANHRHDRVRHVAATMAGVLAGVGLLVALGYALVPAAALTAVFGGLSVDARPVAVLLALQFSLFGVQLGALLVLRSARRARLALGVSAATAPLLLLAPVAGASIGGATGAAAGFLLATLVSVLGWLWAARRALTRAEPVGEQAP